MAALFPARPPDQAARQKRREIDEHDRRADGGAQQVRARQPHAEADDREDPRRDDHAAEALAHAHRRERGEDNQARDEHRAHHAHTQHDRERRQHGEHRVVASDLHARRA